jgi:hypothetical protein
VKQRLHVHNLLELLSCVVRGTLAACTHGALRVISSARLLLSVLVWRPTGVYAVAAGVGLSLNGWCPVELRACSNLDRLPGLGCAWHSIGSSQGLPARSESQDAFRYQTSGQR